VVRAAIEVGTWRDHWYNRHFRYIPRTAQKPTSVDAFAPNFAHLYGSPMTTFGARLRGVDSVWGRNLPFSTDEPSRRQRTTAATAVLTMSLPFSLEAVLRTGGGRFVR